MRRWFDDLVPVPAIVPAEPVIYDDRAPELAGMILQARAAYRYHAEQRTAVYRLLTGIKSRRDITPDIAAGLAPELAKPVAMLIMTWRDFDVITFAPGSVNRGYNLAELIARAAGRAVGLPVLELLSKHVNTPSQRTVKRHAERRMNMLGTIQLNAAPGLVGRGVLVIDDVITTGATIAACGRALRPSGAAVYAAALFSTRRR